MKYSTTKFIWAMTVLVTAILTLSVSSFAGTSWLDKGSDLLKSVGGGDKKSALTIEEIGAGLKEALKVGSENVVNQLGAKEGFNKDSNIHIPLPASLDKVKSMLSKVGMSSLFEDLELKLNRAAEVATPKAKQLFLTAISGMTLEDVKGIYNGPEDAATQYFKGKMSPKLAAEMKPVIEDSLSEVGAVKSYDTMMKEYKSLPFVPDVKANLTGHVIEKGMDGIFYYMAKEEAAIRKDPVKRTTELLQKVFAK
ncbi:MAG: DUF4197 domain-containing protein [Proteobacteria bacterium]|nr:DUF4197 domain-containing protein [Pseudomonadota bacterium]MBU1583371.1 DUF4197 domain-containing protein [Pseudomonadota bacterium]MBU2451920.1 DUF4197 domain-containing protein [Pseudomonadota bacterium]MBU2629628.1 DUF4197 domain-containing protein [Pseudomonadota bacterium]